MMNAHVIADTIVSQNHSHNLLKYPAILPITALHPFLPTMSDAPSGSGPIDGQEIKLDVVPHHQKHAVKKEGPSLLKVAFTGAAVVGGIVGLYLLWKRFFGKKDEKDTKEGGGGKLRRREFKVADVEEEFRGVYEEALADEEFLEFLNEVQESGGLWDE
jgi:hypothetical protein